MYFSNKKSSHLYRFVKGESSITVPPLFIDSSLNQSRKVRSKKELYFFSITGVPGQTSLELRISMFRDHFLGLFVLVHTTHEFSVYKSYRYLSLHYTFAI